VAWVDTVFNDKLWVHRVFKLHCLLEKHRHSSKYTSQPINNSGYFIPKSFMD
jgi:hypothetical protein